MYPLIHMGIYQKVLGEWGIFRMGTTTESNVANSFEFYVSLRLLPDVALKMKHCCFLPNQIDLEEIWSQIWQLEYKQNNNGFRFEVGYFPQNVLQPHVNQQVFIVPTP